MKLRFSMCALTCGLALSIPMAFAESITNGDFSAGNVGFTSDYTHVSYSSGACLPGTTYTVGTNPFACNSNWASFGDHTTGTGNMMIVNGALGTNPGFLKVWNESPLSVSPNTDYLFSAWVAPEYPVRPPADPPAQLRFTIIGLNDGSTSFVDFTANQGTGVWQQMGGSWYSGANVTADIFITDSTIDTGVGNDFALDDISLQPVPEPTSLLLCGTGIVSFLSRKFVQRRAARVSDPSA